MSNLLSVDSGLPSVPADILFNLGPLPVTNSMLAGLLLTVLTALFCIAIYFYTKSSGIPNRFQIILEDTYTIFLDFTAKIVGSKKVAGKILPIIGALFIYIGLSNVLTLLPGIDSLLYEAADGEIVPLFRTHTSDVNTTFGIAAAMIIWTQIYSIRETNVFKHFGKYFKVLAIVKGFRKGLGEGFISIIEFLVGLLDIISEFAKSISLSLRLFGNMFAGLMLSGIILGALAVIAPIPLILFGFFSGILQALVFGALTASYFGMAAENKE